MLARPQQAEGGVDHGTVAGRAKANTLVLAYVGRVSAAAAARVEFARPRSTYV
jgi:hypothetical protein